MVVRVSLLGFLLSWLLLAACSTDDAFSPSPTPSSESGEPSPAPTVTPLPAIRLTPAGEDLPPVIGGVEVVPLAIGEEVDLPDHVAVIMETGCFQCDGPASGLARVYRDSSGEVRSDRLLTIDAFGLPPPTVANPNWADGEVPYFTGFALADDASDIIVGVCTRGFCGGLAYATPGAETTLYRSLDGGVTWRTFGTLSGAFSVVTAAPTGVVLLDMIDPTGRTGPAYQLFPGGEPLEPPMPLHQSWPSFFYRGELIWNTDDGRLLRSDGNEFLALSNDLWQISPNWDVRVDRDGERLATTLGAERLNRFLGYYFGAFRPDGTLTDVFSVKSIPIPGAWLGPDLILGNVGLTRALLPDIELERYQGLIPALFDLDQGTLHPIPHPFLDDSFAIPNHRNRVQAVMHGPFARVDGTGSCLKVRSEPRLDAPALACAADRVLLRDTGETRDVVGATWLRVVTPAGVEGWSGAAFLAR